MKRRPWRLRQVDVDVGRLVYPETPEPLPRTRGECRNGIRPCPWASCRYHLAVSIASDGSMRQREDADDLADTTLPTCALDVAAQGAHRMTEIAEVMGTSRQRIEQVSTAALAKARAEAERLGLTLDDLLPPPSPSGHDWDKAGDRWDYGERTTPAQKAYQARRWAAAQAKGAA